MNQEVKVTIHGMQQYTSEEADDTEVVCLGKMYEKDGFDCIVYEEVDAEGSKGISNTVKNMIKVSDEQVEIIKEGTSSSHMVFIRNQMEYSFYSTPFGELEIGVFTKNMNKKDTEQGFLVQLEYNLEMGHSHISTCNVEIEVEKQKRR